MNEGFVVFDRDTTVALKENYGGLKVFKSGAAAKAAITRETRKANAKGKELFLSFCSVSEFANVEKKVKRVNLMSGKEYYEGVNTPRYCSPSSEAYWSM